MRHLDIWLRDFIYLSLLLFINKLIMILYNNKLIMSDKFIIFYLIIIVQIISTMYGIVLLVKLTKRIYVKRIIYLVVFLLLYIVIFIFSYRLDLRNINIISIAELLIIIYYGTKIIRYYIIFKKSEKLYKKVLFYTNRNKFKRALKYLEKYKQEEMKFQDIKPYVYLCLKGEIYKLQGNNDEALQIYKRALNLYNQDEDFQYRTNIRVYLMDVYFNLIELLKEINEYKQVKYYNKELILLVKKILSLNNNQQLIYQESLFEIGRLFHEYNYNKRAIKYLRKIKNRRDNCEVTYILGIAYFHIKKYKKALAEFNKLKKEKRYQMFLYYWYIRINLEIDNREKAFNYLIEVTNKELDFYVQYRSPDDNYLPNTEKEKYLEFMIDRFKMEKRKISRSKKAKIADVIIFLLFELKKDKEAYRYIQVLKSLYPVHKKTYYWQIILQFKKNDYEKAKKIYNETVKKYPDFFEIYNWTEANLEKEKAREILQN